MVGYLNKKFAHSLLNINSEYLFPILRAPDQMIFSFINRMTRPFNIHAEYFIWKAPLPKNVVIKSGWIFEDKIV
jgi:hypothetical protein